MMEKRKQLLIRLFALLCSMLFLAAGIVIFLKCRLGSDPLTVLYDGISATLHITYAQASGIYNLTMFLLAFLFARRYFGVGTIIVSFSLSFFIGFYEKLFSMVPFGTMAVWQRLLWILAGQVVMCLGMALSVWADLGMNCSLAVLYRLSDITGIRFKVLKTGNDILFAVAGFLMGGIIGIGTVYSAATTGVMITYLKNQLDRHIFSTHSAKKTDKKFQK